MRHTGYKKHQVYAEGWSKGEDFPKERSSLVEGELDKV